VKAVSLDKLPHAARLLLVSLLRLFVVVKISILQIATIVNIYKVEERENVAPFKIHKALLFIIMIKDQVKKMKVAHLLAVDNQQDQAIFQ
jgi:hypothetical protein